MKRFIFSAAIAGLVACGGNSDKKNANPQEPEVTTTQSDEKFVQAAGLLDEPTAIFAETLSANNDPFLSSPAKSQASELQSVLKDMGDLVSKGQKNPELVSINQICDLSSKGKSLSQNFVNAEELEIRTGDLEIIKKSFTQIETIFSCGGTTTTPKPTNPTPSCGKVGQYDCNPCDIASQYNCNPCDTVGQYDCNPCDKYGKNPCNPCGIEKPCQGAFIPFKNKAFTSHYSTGNQWVGASIKFYGADKAYYRNVYGKEGQLFDLKYNAHTMTLTGRWKNNQDSGWFSFKFTKNYQNKVSFEGQWGVYKTSHWHAAEKVTKGHWKGVEAAGHGLPY